MSAQSWSVKGIDPKVREAAREAAARQGMTLAEYLNQALAGQTPPPGATPPAAPAPRRAQRYLGAHDLESEEEDWQVGAGRTDPARLAQRVESIERRTQLAVTGLDRAVATIDRSVLGLAARLDDAEAMSTEAADRITQALEQFRIAGETLSGRLEQAEMEALQSRDALEGARSDMHEIRHRLQHQIAAADEVARRAEAAVSLLASEIENGGSQTQTLELARAVAEEAARQAAEASAEAVQELRSLHQQMSHRLVEAESSTRQAIENAIAEVRSESAVETRSTREALLEEVVRLESEIAKRLDAAEQVKSEQAALLARIEKAESGAREATAGLRQAAGAAIADLRNAQLTLTARVKQIEESGGGVDLTDLRQAQQDIAERLANLEAKSDAGPLKDAIAAFESRLANVEHAAPRLDEVDGAVKTLDSALQRLAERIAETETTANTAIRTLEETVSSIGARVEQATAADETEAVRAMLENRLDAMAQSVTQMVIEARSELAGQLQSAVEGTTSGLEGALADVNRRLAVAERRQIQTIEAISIEIKHMSEMVDKRLRAVEARNDDAAAAAIREELTRMGTQLEQRFDDIERREAAAFDRVGLEVGRLSERLEERVGAVESRSAQAIEHVGEQVARMAERFNQRHESLSRDLGERMLDSEERSNARVADAINSIMQRLAEVEERSAEAIAPVQKAVTSVASKLDAYESERRGGEPEPAEPLLTIPTPTRRTSDFESFGSDLADAAPAERKEPLRAGPLPPAALNDDVYFAEDIDDLLVEDIDDTETSQPQFSSDAVDPVDTDQAMPALFTDGQNETPDPDVPLWSNDPLPSTDAPFAPDVFGVVNETPKAADVADIPLFTAPVAQPEAQAKPDYLANARRAAQAQTRAEPGPTPRLSLRGSSRIIIWGAASAAAVMMLGGAWFMNTRDQQAAQPTTEPAPTPEQAPATTTTAEGDAAPVDPFVTPPTGEATDAPPVVAGPLPPQSGASLQQAAQAGDLTAQYEYGLQQLAAGRTQEGVTLLRRAADRGFAMAQYRVAKLYERGEGVPVDLAVARQWTERAAASGNRRAMHDLGVYFARGEGAPLDEGAAFRWFRQAAELGVADSQYNLGVLYQQGRGVNPSASEALFWFLVASRQGDQDAAARAAALEAQLEPIQVQQARARAQAFRPRATNAVANGEFGPRPWAQQPAR